ncbi:hypothetical protein [Bradyrhizobium sp. CCBAU 53421]|uniref:hypothetical protein n=1 Tax=Bradyrhizobium sp. CCBAU 53421 TaxID=1325120 RepID=UPI00188A46BF|nr:hypothetical protein [Bradyrhizobium sp. CCBAU 53421]
MSDFAPCRKRRARVSSRDDVNDCVVASLLARNCVIVGHQVELPSSNDGESDHRFCDANAVVRDVIAADRNVSGINAQ